MSNALQRRDEAWLGLPASWRWRQAGLYMDLTGLGRPLPSRQLSPPHGVVEVEAGRLVQRRRIGAGAEMVDAPADLLERFASLRKADDERVAVFAQQYGLFYFCEHGNPGAVHVDALGGAAVCTYAGVPWPEQAHGGMVSVPDAPDRKPKPGESCSEWRELASEAWSCLEVAAALHLARPPKPEHLQALVPVDTAGMGREETIAAARVGLEETVRSWLQHAMVQLVYRWRPTWTEPRLEMGSGSAHGSRLFGELAMQLAFTTARAGGFAVCSECGNPFTPTRRPKLGQRTFCPTCRAGGAPQRAAARDWARRRKESERG